MITTPGRPHLPTLTTPMPRTEITTIETRTTLTTRRSGGSRPRLHRSSLRGRRERGADTIITIILRLRGPADPGELPLRETPALGPGRDMLRLLPQVTTTVITGLEVVEGSEVARTGLIPGCEEVPIDGREGAGAEAGQLTDMAGREVTPAAAVGVAVAPVGAVVPDEGGDTRPPTPADHHQGLGAGAPHLPGSPGAVRPVPGRSRRKEPEPEGAGGARRRFRRGWRG